MDNLIKVYDDVIDKDSCNLLIGKFETNEDRLEDVYEEDGDEKIAFKQLQMVKFEEWKSIQEGMLEVFQDYIMRIKLTVILKINNGRQNMVMKLSE